MFFFIGYWVIAGPGTYLFLSGKKRSQHSWTAFAAAAVVATALTVFVVDLVLRGPGDPPCDRRSASPPAPRCSRQWRTAGSDCTSRNEGAEGFAGRYFGDFITYVTPMSMHPSYVPDNEFPANLDYFVPVRDAGMTEPAAISVPFRSTLKKLDVKWSGIWRGPIRASGIKLDPNSTGITGNLDNFSGIDLKNVYIAFRYNQDDWVMYLTGLSSKTGDTTWISKEFWDKAALLPLGVEPAG